MNTNRASLLLSFVLVGWTAIGCQQDAGDSIVAWYPARGRVSVFGPDGSYGRSFGLWGDCPPACPGAVAARRDGTILTTYPGEVSDSALLQVRDGDGVLLASLEKLPDRDLRL